MNKDVSIFYYGGTGGFFVLHLLFLSGAYGCVWEGDTQSWDEIFHRQWDIQDVALWKQSETWPDNFLTMESDVPRKIYLFCNPSAECFEIFETVNDLTRIVVYTDIETQWLNITSKNCFMFAHSSSPSEFVRESFVSLYNNIRGSDWPDVSRLEDFATLPDQIKNEIMTKFDAPWVVSENAFLNNIKQTQLASIKFRGIDIYEKYKNEIDIDQADFNFSLQELIQSQGKCLYSALGLEWSERCADFTNQYLALHPTILRNALIK